ncbi:MAG: hypothetical protein U1B80_05760 [Anaerolineaceae bacterium]|nr:hypothetical protein [Anaerolineaceae bacterium]
MNKRVRGCDNPKKPADQSLAAKVEELAEMDRIVLQLHASLDPREVLRTALKWAVQRLNADCGLAGLLVEGGVKVMASQGYSNELAQLEEDLIPAGFLPLERLAEAGFPNSIELRAGESQRLLASARRQTLAPMGCGPSLRGVILLEHKSAQPLPAPALDFMTRLFGSIPYMVG